MYDLVARDCEKASFDGFERNQKSKSVMLHRDLAIIRDNAAAVLVVVSQSTNE